MTRTILFRGKVVKDAKRRPGEWVFGELTNVHYKLSHIDEPMIVEPEPDAQNSNNMFAYAYRVEPASVGQFTGFKDSEGAMLFEGDLLIAVPNSSKDDDETEYRILWSNEHGCWIVVENRSGEFFDWLTSDIADKFFSVMEP